MASITATTAYLNLLRNATSSADVAAITYVAIGSSSAVPDPSDTKLGAESFRKKVTAYTSGGTGEVFVNLYLAPTDAVGANIQEVGLFGGASATSAANSGVLYGRALYSHNPKTNRESIQITLDITFSSN